MSLGLIEISVELRQCYLTSWVVNEQVIGERQSQNKDSSFENQLVVINEEIISVMLVIAGPIGGQARLIVHQLTSGLTYHEDLIILKDEEARRNYRITIEDLNSFGEDELQPLALPTSGEIERGFAQVLCSPNYEVEVFYATDRAINKSEEGQLIYTSDSNGLSFGRCLINIPSKHKLGEIERPHWWHLEFRQNKDKHMMILDKQTFLQEEFLFALSTKMSTSTQNDAFIFIHGFNTSFEGGLYRTAQLAYDLNFMGAPIYYSWPSFGDVLNYPEDEQRVAKAIQPFKELLTILKPIIGERKVHLIAHSMGNRLLTSTIHQLQEDAFFQRPVFDQVILAAPDVDANEFLEGFAQCVVSSSKRTTLYASSGDRALKISRGINSSILRLGESGKMITCFQGLDTVDATNTDPSLLGHGYFSTTASLIGDIFSLFRFNFPPANRNLVLRNSGDEHYWEFR